MIYYKIQRLIINVSRFTKSIIIVEVEVIII